MTEMPLGQLIALTLRGQKVDTAHLTWTSENRVGLYFLERGVPPRASRVHYDRRDSAMAHMTPADLPDPLFKKGRADLLHTSGITAAISPSATQTARAAIQKAKAVGWLVSFDFNYHSSL
jgi:2-dehydro-3-deoxygluconokinase